MVVDAAITLKNKSLGGLLTGGESVLWGLGGDSLLLGVRLVKLH